MEVNNLLSKEVEDVHTTIKWVETNIIEVNNLIKLLSRSFQDSSDISVKEVLDIADKKIENLLSLMSSSLYVNLDNLKSMALEAESKPKRQRRPRNNNTDTPKRVRAQRKPKETDNTKDNVPDKDINKNEKDNNIKTDKTTDK